MKQRIAIIGGGLSGLVCGHLLFSHADITLFEVKEYLGGQSFTHKIAENSTKTEIDMGFILFNKKAYPYFIELLESLDIPLHKSDLSFSFFGRHLHTYKGAQLGNPFYPPKNLLSGKTYQLFADILKLNNHVKQFLAQPEDLTVASFLKQHQISSSVTEAYLSPLLNTLISCPENALNQISAQFAFAYLEKNGLLDTLFKPAWYFLKGGSKAYLEPLSKPFKQRIQLKSHIQSIERDKYFVTIKADGIKHTFDSVIFATQANQALESLTNPSPLEQHILGSIQYTARKVYLHTDKSVMPPDKELWAAINYKKVDHPIITYHANKVQDLSSEKDYFITLSEGNPISQHKIITESVLRRPFITPKALVNQNRFQEINGLLNTYYCGAYWGFGTHEDAVSSAFRAVEPIIKKIHS